MRQDSSKQVISLVLVAPLLLFLVVFFAFPLVTMMKSAVSDPVAARALPATARAVAGWDRVSPPTEAMKLPLLPTYARSMTTNCLGTLYGD